MKRPRKTTELRALRPKAEELLKSKQLKTNSQLSEVDTLKLIHELQVHQIELELQNEELIFAKEKAELAEKKYTELYEFASSGYLSLTKNGEIAEINILAANMLGKERSFLRNRIFRIFIDEASLPVFNSFFQNVFTTNVKQTCEVAISVEGNLPITVNITGIVSQNSEQCLLTLIDVSERIQTKIALKDSEDKYHITKSDLQKAQSIAQIGNWKWNCRTKDFNWSDEIFHLLGIDKSSITGQLRNIILKVIHPDDLHIVLSPNIFNIVQEESIEFRIVMPDKSIRHIWVEAGEKTLDESGNPLYLSGIVQDITERKIKEIELTEAKIEAELATKIAESAKKKAESATQIAEDAVKAKQQFLSNMSHEIRTPMNAIIGFTKVLMKTDLSSKQKEYLSAIKISGDALIVLINDILDLAKVDAGKMTFKQTPFKMALSISAMLHLFEPKIQEKNLLLIKEYDTRIPDVLVGDPVRLHQIVLNLVSNAIKFTAFGKISVSVHLLSECDKTVTIEFAVSDSGIGIAEDKIDMIFENFQQAYNSTSSIYGGTGLGLAIVKQLVESQGGTIQVKSKINEGSTFSFSLCFQKTDAEAENETEIVELDLDLGKLKILAVEDIVLNQLLLKTILEDFGFLCDIADNGKIAIEKLQSNTYDVILMDLQMPEMNGFQATEHIRKSMNSDIPIIALTADVTSVDLVKCKAAGMNDYIAKPIDEKLLYSKIVGIAKKSILNIENEFDKMIEPRKLKCIDLDYLICRTKSNPELMMEMISIYLEQTPPLINLMKQSFHDNNWKLLYSSVHKMIPSFSIMGIDKKFENMAKQVQEYASTQIASNEISEFVLQLETVSLQACKELAIEYDIFKKTLNN